MIRPAVCERSIAMEQNKEHSRVFLAGWAQTDLTPSKKVGLCGQFAERISEYVETPVYATSLALQAGETTAVFCACDLVSVSLNLQELVRERVKTLAPDLDPRMVILSATHSHTSLDYKIQNIDAGSSLKVLRDFLPEQEQPEAAPAPDVMGQEEALFWLAERISLSVSEAWKNRAPASCANEFGRAAVGLCRRTVYRDGHAAMWGDTFTPDFEALEGGSDSGVELLYFFDAEGQLSGVAANLACPAQTVQHRLFVSSDFWGKTRIILQAVLGRPVPLLPLCAPAGDQCPVDLVRFVEPLSDVHDPNIIRKAPPKRKADPSMFDIPGSWRAGRRVANEIMEYLPDAEREKAVPEIFTHEVLDLRLPLRTVSAEEKDEALEKITAYLEKAGGRDFTYEDEAAMHVYAGTAARYEYQQDHPDFPAEVHILRLGNVAFASDPFELFLDYGNQIRALSPAEQTFLIQLACGDLGYLPTARAEAGGHYSAYVSSGLTGHEGGEKLVRETLKAIRKQFGEPG